MQNVFNVLRQFGPFGFIAIGVAIFGVIMTLAIYGARQRTKAMQELAEELGFEFTPRADLSVIRLIPRIQLFLSGRNQQINNLLSGSTESTRVLIFDWQYVTGSGKNSHTHSTTVVVIESADLDLPAFYCRPETVLDRLGLTFDGKDIDFEDRPIFSKKFHLHGNLEKRIRQTFDVEVCEYFETHLGMYAEGNRQWLVYYENDKRVVSDKLRDRFKDAFQLYVLLKATSADSTAAAGDSTPAVADQPRDEMSAESEREL